MKLIKNVLGTIATIAAVLGTAWFLGWLLLDGAWSRSFG